MIFLFIYFWFTFDTGLPMKYGGSIEHNYSGVGEWSIESNKNTFKNKKQWNFPIFFNIKNEN